MLRQADHLSGKEDGSGRQDHGKLTEAQGGSGRAQGKAGHHDERAKSKERPKRARRESSRREHKHTGTAAPTSHNPRTTERDNETGLFIADRRGDPNNLTYGTIHRYDIPRYNRIGAGNVIGLPSDQKIDRTSSNDKTLVTSDRNSIKADRRERSLLSKSDLNNVGELRIRNIESRDPTLENGSDFIALVRSRKRKRKLGGKPTSSVSGSSDEADESHYRSIEGKAIQQKGPADEDLEYATDSTTSEDGQRRMVSIDEATRQRGIELARRVDSHPKDVDAWLGLIDHQDRSLGVGRDGTQQKLTNAETRSIAEVKLSIYEKALGKVGRDDQLERLVIGMMEEGSKVWETKKLGNKWQSVLEEYPGYIGLWTKYLDFKQTNFISFQYEDCRSVYLNCFKVLNSVSTTKPQSPLCRDDVDKIRIYILLRLTFFMRESGYVEHAVGLWQGILEFNFFRPRQFDVLADTGREEGSLTDPVSSFEEFWESEVPRIGEEGAKGWKSWTTNGGVTAAPRTDMPSRLVQDEQVFESWTHCERHRALGSRLPARTIDDVQEDDPFRVVLFSDISDCLFYTANAPLQASLLNAFLAFCRLPVLPLEFSDSHVLDFRTESLTANDALEESSLFIGRWFSDRIDHKDPSHDDNSIQPVDYERKALFNFPAQNFLLSPDSLFSGEGEWFSAFDSWAFRYDGDNGPVEQAWISRILRMLVDVSIGGDNLAEYYLAFEMKNNPGNTRKLAKSLLKKHTTSLRLYNAYALIEARHGNKTTADHVFETAINMSNNFAAHERHNAILLWRTWIWEDLTRADHRSALKRLLALSGVPNTQETKAADPPTTTTPFKPSPAALLRTQRVSVPKAQTEMY